MNREIRVFLALCALVGAVIGLVIRVHRLERAVADGVRVFDSFPARLPSPPRPDDTATSIYDAIRQVESGGNDYAVGDGGRSRGPVQCGRAAWQDACEYGKADLRYDKHVWDYAVCKQIMTWYWQRYDCDTDEKKARCWNGGPAGHLKESTIPYWEKVQSHLKTK